MERFLLDTYVMLWWLNEDPSLKEHARQIIADSRNDVAVSAVSAWEVAIKRSVGRLRLTADIEEAIDASHLRKLPITFAHALATEHLPLRHGDPFDRLLIAQAQLEHLTLVTHDTQMQKYDVDVMLA